jgi:uncharacterized membrane protein
MHGNSGTEVVWGEEVVPPTPPVVVVVVIVAVFLCCVLASCYLRITENPPSQNESTEAPR